MFGFGATEITIVVLLAIVLFGAKRLPELGRGLGQSLGEFKKGVRELKSDLDVGLHDPSPARPQRRLETKDALAPPSESST